jgi:hypothetical protein
VPTWETDPQGEARRFSLQGLRRGCEEKEEALQSEEGEVIVVGSSLCLA